MCRGALTGQPWATPHCSPTPTASSTLYLEKLVRTRARALVARLCAGACPLRRLHQGVVNTMAALPGPNRRVGAPLSGRSTPTGAAGRRTITWLSGGQGVRRVVRLPAASARTGDATTLAPDLLPPPPHPRPHPRLLVWTCARALGRRGEVLRARLLWRRRVQPPA
jgi:hypothetical protein